MHRHKSREEATEGEGGRCGDPFALKSPGINFNIRNFNQIGKLVRDTFHVVTRIFKPLFVFSGHAASKGLKAEQILTERSLSAI